MTFTVSIGGIPFSVTKTIGCDAADFSYSFSGFSPQAEVISRLFTEAIGGSVSWYALL
jgi:hypothetical protein